jgi:adhesin transport system membrane fusion protein
VARAGGYRSGRGTIRDGGAPARDACRVNRVLVSTVGGSIGAGQPIAEVVPSADALTVEALVSPKDIAAVRIGQRARVNITAYESGIYGGMDGQVVTISPDATIEERTGESHYTVRVRADAQRFRDPQGRRLVIGPGMTADVNLIGDKRSVIAYILTPFTRLSEEALRE